MKISDELRQYIRYKSSDILVLHGNCLKILPILYLLGCRVDMVLADPPYGMTQNKWDSVIPLTEMWASLEGVTKQSGAMVFTAATPFDKVLGASNVKLLKYEWIWHKNKASGHLNAKKMPMRAHENILVFYRKPPTYNPQFTDGHEPLHFAINGNSDNYGEYDSQESRTGETTRYPRTVLNFPVVNNDSPEKFHPNQKPVSLLSYLISTYTNPKELVLDFCAGSGSTALAAIETGRRCIVIEKDEDEKYIDIIINRIKNAR